LENYYFAPPDVKVTDFFYKIKNTNTNIFHRVYYKLSIEKELKQPNFYELNIL